MAEASTILDCLRNHADSEPSRLAFRFIQNRESQRALDYGQLQQRVAGIAKSIGQYTTSLDRALLMYPPGLEFVEAFLGSLAAGVIATPCSLPRRSQRNPRFLAVMADSEPEVILSTSALLPLIEEAVLASDRNIPIVLTDQVDSQDSWEFEKVDDSQIAFLQYTSGSTSKPKGVMVTHRNLMHNESAIRQFSRSGRDDLLVGWLPAFHDMGLIGTILQPLYSGFPSVLMSPTEFGRKPIIWLQAISDFRATITGGPNSAYDYCRKSVKLADLTGLDLSSLRATFVGSEPVSRQTLDLFGERFSSFGFPMKSFLPCYGFAEATLIATGADHGKGYKSLRVDRSDLELGVATQREDRQDLVTSIISSGKAFSDSMIRVVDPESGELCPSGHVGEVWIASPSVALGYWKKDEETKTVFDAKLESEPGAFLRTGDLGFLDEGELYITGRLKDVIILGGRNLYPQDIEEILEDELKLPVSNSCAAFSITVGTQEVLALAIEASRAQVRMTKPVEGGEIADSLSEFDKLISRLQRRLAAELEVARELILFLRPGRFPRTTSGKVQRQYLKNSWEKLELVYQWRGRNLPELS